MPKNSEWGCKYATAGTVLIDQHYSELGLDKGWDKERVDRLCRMLKVTPYELGRLVCVDFKLTKRMLEADNFPPHIALHFALIECWYLEQVKGLKQQPIVPIHLLT